MRDTLQLFEIDYIIGWDFSDKDLPAVYVTRLRRDGCQVLAEVIGGAHTKVGCISLRQVLEDYETCQREEKERAQRLKDSLRAASENFAKMAASATDAADAMRNLDDAVKE